MKLLLTSSGISNKSIEEVMLELLGKPFKEAHLTFIPTAANVEEGDKAWLIQDMYNFKKLGFSTIDVVDISAVPKEIWLRSIRHADVLVFGGGNVKYLLTWLEKSGLKELLSTLLKKKVYVGISAGSMVTAKKVSLSSASILYYEKTGRFEIVNGLGFVDFEIWPHLNSNWFPKVRVDYLSKLAPKIQTTFYGIDDDTAIKVVDGKIEIISEGEWEKFN